MSKREEILERFQSPVLERSIGLSNFTHALSRELQLRYTNRSQSGPTQHSKVLSCPSNSMSTNSASRTSQAKLKCEHACARAAQRLHTFALSPADLHAAAAAHSYSVFLRASTEYGPNCEARPFFCRVSLSLTRLKHALFPTRTSRRNANFLASLFF